MEGPQDPEDGSISLDGGNQVASSDQNHLQFVSQRSQLPHIPGDSRQRISVIIPSVELSKGNFDRANFGPQTNTQNIHESNIEHATIIQHHHHHSHAAELQTPYDALRSSEVQGKRIGEGSGNANRDTNGSVEICDDTFMCTEKPIKERSQVYTGYQVHVTGQREQLAIKKIVPCEEKSIREVKHLVNLSPHPNVVRIIRSKVHQGLTHRELYIAMELCQQKNLQDYLKENGDKNKPVDFNQAMLYSKQLVNGMKHIHRNRIIHGDLKPANILFSLDDEQIKVSDFGISKQLRDEKSVTKLTGLGTDGYRAPETYSSHIISKSADVYSFGINLYSLFTNGKHPFGEDPHLQIYNIKKNIGRDLCGIPDEMGQKKPELIDLLEKVLQFDPRKRPTMEQVSKHPFFSSDPSLHSPHVVASKAGDAETVTASSAAILTVPLKFSEPIGSYRPLTSSVCDVGTMASPSTPTPSENATFKRPMGPFSPTSARLTSSVGTLRTAASITSGSKSRRSKKNPVDSQKLKWHLTRSTFSYRSFDTIIPNIDSGCRICFDPERSYSKKDLYPFKVVINGREKLIADLDDINLSLFRTTEPCVPPHALWPGIVVWFDRYTSQLFAMNMCDKSTRVNFRNEFRPGAKFGSLLFGNSVPIFPLEELTKFVARQKRKNGRNHVSLGVEFEFSSLSIVPSSSVFRIAPTIK